MQKIREIRMKRKRNDNLIIITDNQVTLFLHDSTLSRKLLSIEIFSSIKTNIFAVHQFNYQVRVGELLKIMEMTFHWSKKWISKFEKYFWQ